MDQYFVIYNPLAGDGDGKEVADCIEVVLDTVVGKADITKISNYSAFLADKTEYRLIICGGDGTLHRFINDTKELSIPNRIFYYATGTKNDFWQDLEGTRMEMPVEITEEIEKLPLCEVNGKKYHFLNGVAHGMEESSEGQRRRPIGVTVTVDGEQQRFEKAWLVSTMFGSYCGGLLQTPNQTRPKEQQETTLFVLHGVGNIRRCRMLHRMRRGKYLKSTKHVSVIKGKEVVVELDYPRTLQMDGEMIENVKEYAVRFGAPMKRAKRNV